MRNNILHTTTLYFALSITLVLILSCTEKRSYNYLDRSSIIATLDAIDSTLTTLKGYEPKDLEYTPKNAPFEEPVQETFDTASVTWRKFVDLCKKENFEEAYKFYNKDDNSGDIIVCLKHSTPRYHFYREVLKPMIYEFEVKDSADEKYLDILKLEYYLEEFTMQYGAGNSDYIPDTFPDISIELGEMLAAQGRIDEALEMVDDYAYAVNGLSGDAAYTNFNLTLFVSFLYNSAGDHENAIQVLEDYKLYTNENKDPDKDSAEYEQYYKQIDEAIALQKGAK